MLEIKAKMIFLVKILLLCQILQQTIALGSNNNEETGLPEKIPSNKTKLPEYFFQSYFNGWLIKQYNWWKTNENKRSEKFPKDVESFFRYLKWEEEPTAESLMEKMKKETNETISGLVGDLGEEKALSLFGYYLTLPYETARLKAVENNGTFYEDHGAPSLNELLANLLILKYATKLLGGSSPIASAYRKFSFESVLRVLALEKYLEEIENDRACSNKQVAMSYTTDFKPIEYWCNAECTMLAQQHEKSFCKNTCLCR